MHNRPSEWNKKKIEVYRARLRFARSTWWKLHCPLRCNGNTINCWTTRQIHLKQYPINASKMKHIHTYTQHETKRNEQRKKYIKTTTTATIWHVFVEQQEKNFTQSTIWDFAIFHQYTPVKLQFFFLQFLLFFCTLTFGWEWNADVQIWFMQLTITHTHASHTKQTNYLPLHKWYFS